MQIFHVQPASTEYFSKTLSDQPHGVGVGNLDTHKNFFATMAMIPMGGLEVARHSVTELVP